MLRPLICFVVALLVCQSANALLIETGPFTAYPVQYPYISAYSNIGGSVTNNVATYDPDLDLLYILPLSGPADFRIRPTNFNEEFYFSGALLLLMSIDENRQSPGGLFSLFGAVPDLGIDTPTTLLAGTIVDANIWAGGNDGYGYAPMEFLIGLNFVNPDFGNWGPQAVLLGLNHPVYGFVPITTDDMFQKAWSVAPSDYWDLWSVAQVPEPGTLSLLAAGLLALGLMRRRLTA